MRSAIAGSASTLSKVSQALALRRSRMTSPGRSSAPRGGPPWGTKRGCAAVSEITDSRGSRSARSAIAASVTRSSRWSSWTNSTGCAGYASSKATCPIVLGSFPIGCATIAYAFRSRPPRSPVSSRRGGTLHHSFGTQRGPCADILPVDKWAPITPLSWPIVATVAGFDIEPFGPDELSQNCHDVGRPRRIRATSTRSSHSTDGGSSPFLTDMATSIRLGCTSPASIPPALGRGRRGTHSMSNLNRSGATEARTTSTPARRRRPWSHRATWGS